MEKVFVVTYEGYDGRLNDFVTCVLGTYKTIESAGKLIDEAKALHRKDETDKIFYEEWSKNKYYKVRYWSDPENFSCDELRNYEQDSYMIYEQELAD